MFLKFFCSEIVGTTFIIYILSKGMTMYHASIILASFALTVLIMEIPTGIVADLLGRRFSVVSGCILQGVAYFLLLRGNRFEVLVCAQIVTGIAYTLSSGALEAWVVDYIKYENKDVNIDKLMSTGFMVRNSAGMICGLLGAFLASINMDIPWVVSIISLGVTAGFALLVMKEPYFTRKVEKHTLVDMKSSVKEIFSDSFKFGFKNRYLIAAFVVGILVFFSNAAGNSLQQPRLLTLSGHGIYILGPMKVGISIAMMFGSKIVLRLVRKYSDGAVVGMACFMIGFWLICSGIFNSFGVVLGVFLVYEIGRGMYQPAMQIYLNNRINNDKRATILSFASGISQLGLVIGSVISGAMTSGVTSEIQEQGSIRVVWIIFGAVALVAGVSALKFMRSGNRTLGNRINKEEKTVSK